MRHDNDPHLHEIIAYLRPFIDGEVTDVCAKPDDHDYCEGNQVSGLLHGHHCECPCHWTQDMIALKLIEIMESHEPSPIAGTWLGSYMGRQKQEAKRLLSLSHGRDKMVERVMKALVGPDA